MSVDGAVDRRRDGMTVTGNGNGVVAPGIHSSRRLLVKANAEHKSDSYDDLQLEFSPLLFSYLEQYLPPAMLNMSRDNKILHMREILHKYWPDGERFRVQRHKDHRLRIMSYYQPLNKDLYSLNVSHFIVPSFLKAIGENKEDSFKSIMLQPAPGIYTFEIFKPQFCEWLMAEVENFEKWVCDSQFRVMRPNTMNKYGAVLDDFGLEPMLNKLMEDFVSPLAKVFFSDAGGNMLDSHHGFVVEYGTDRDVDLGFHVDDAEVTLNVCLGKQFSGGELYFRGVRCDKHVSTETQPEEVFDYSHIPGHAILHRGRHRHGARATTNGRRINLILWCRSSVFRELRKFQKEYCDWCGECQREKKERMQSSVAATRLELLKKDVESTTT